MWAEEEKVVESKRKTDCLDPLYKGRLLRLQIQLCDAKKGIKELS